MFSDNSIRRVFYDWNLKCSKQTTTTHHKETKRKTRCMWKITSFEQCQRFYFSLFSHLAGCLYIKRAKTQTQKRKQKILKNIDRKQEEI